MPTIHTAARLAKTLTKHLSTDAKGDPTQPLDYFYADTFTVQRKRCWIVMHDPTAFVVLLPGMTATRIQQAGAVLAKALHTQLARASLSAPQNALDHLSENTLLARTHANRRLTGKLNEAKRHLDYQRARYPTYEDYPWLEVGHQINTIPLPPPPGYEHLATMGYATPIEIMSAHLNETPGDALLTRSSGFAKPLPLPPALQHAFKAAPVSKAEQYASQQHYYDALEAPTPTEQQRLLQLALKYDPRNVDALLVQLQSRPQTSALTEAYRQLVALAEENLGPNRDQYSGGWWGLLETRPYLRARAQLATALERDGAWREARDEYRALLALNPHDNQGIRFQLGPLLLKHGALAEHKELLATYGGR